MRSTDHRRPMTPVFTLAEVLAIVQPKRPYASIPLGIRTDRERMVRRFHEIAEERT